MERVVKNYKEDVLETFSAYKKMAERALEQVADDDFDREIDPESNSIAVIVKHITGNQRSRFTDFLTTDGEKAERDRDSEFVIEEETREQLMEKWESGWETMFSSLEGLKLNDFSGTVAIRGEPHSVVQAVNRQLTHYAYHIGQIVFLAKHFRSSGWNTLSVPRNSSEQFNEFLKAKRLRGDEQSHPLEGPAEFARKLE